MNCEDIINYINLRSSGKVFVRTNFVDYMTDGESELSHKRLPVILALKLSEKFGEKVFNRNMSADIPAEWLPTICGHYNTTKLQVIVDIGFLTYPDLHIDDSTAKVLKSIVKGHIGGSLDEYLTHLKKQAPGKASICLQLPIDGGLPSSTTPAVKEVTLTANDSLKQRAFKARENGKTNLSRVQIDAAGSILPMNLKQILFLISTDKDNQNYTCGLTPSETDILSSAIDTYILLLTGSLPERNSDGEVVYPLEAFFIISHTYRKLIDSLRYSEPTHY